MVDLGNRHLSRYSCPREPPQSPARGTFADTLSAAHSNYLASLARENVVFLQVIVFPKTLAIFLKRSARESSDE